MTPQVNAHDGELIGLRTDLVSIRSFFGEESEVQTWIANWIERQGMAAATEDADAGLKNIVVTVEGNEGARSLDWRSLRFRWPCVQLDESAACASGRTGRTCAPAMSPA